MYTMVEWPKAKSSTHPLHLNWHRWQHKAMQSKNGTTVDHGTTCIANP